MSIFESLVVLNIENHTDLELTVLAYSQEFDNVFALSCQMSRAKEDVM